MVHTSGGGEPQLLAVGANQSAARVVVDAREDSLDGRLQRVGHRFAVVQQQEIEVVVTPDGQISVALLELVCVPCGIVQGGAHNLDTRTRGWGIGGAQVQPLTPTPPKPPEGARGEGGGASWARAAGTPTYVRQNDPLVALIILNTHIRSGPSGQAWGAGWGQGPEKKFMCCTHIGIPHEILSILRKHTWG